MWRSGHSMSHWIAWLLIQQVAVGSAAVLPLETRLNVRYGGRQVKLNLKTVQPLRTAPMYTPQLGADGRMRVPLMLIADMDQQSPSATNAGLFVSPSVRGYLDYNLVTDEYMVLWQYTFNYTSSLNLKGRGMELSDLKVFNGHLYAPDDKTGIIFRLTTDMAIPWVVNADGDGFDNKTFKCEWMTTKDEELWIGGYGKEYTDEKGKYLNSKPLWIRVIDRFGVVRQVNWEHEFKRIRAAVGIHFPAYLIHESCQWSDVHQRWFFLPRKAAWTAYDEAQDQFMGANLLIKADERFESFEVVRVGMARPTRGFSAFQFVPGSQDTVIVALKSEEITNWPLATYIMVFGIDGTVYMDETKVPGDFKLEGLEFFDFKHIETF